MKYVRAARRTTPRPLYAHSITSSARAIRVRGISKAKRFGVLEVDDECDLRRLLNGQVGQLLAFENPADVGTDPAIHWFHSSSSRQLRRSPDMGRSRALHVGA